ncbi:hypothetical protein JTE90_014715 [Oedothorax gibbosus]|uniref:Uncharacterized protein n=1 Tax=Oedothorax gibbosus TaxID=931172 RepID=A0AAV6USA4_9ARAC|nr:hypothetical protein JTE90_014715 [Oedothorax gibbosus]
MGETRHFSQTSFQNSFLAQKRPLKPSCTKAEPRTFPPVKINSTYGPQTSKKAIVSAPHPKEACRVVGGHVPDGQMARTSTVGRRGLTGSLMFEAFSCLVRQTAVTAYKRGKAIRTVKREIVGRFLCKYDVEPLFK